MSQLNFLFWNLNKKNLIEEVSNIVSKHDIDVLILAEIGINQNELLLELQKGDAFFSMNHPISQCTKIQIFTRFDYKFIVPIEEGRDNRYTIRRLQLPTFEAINIVGVHLPDKGNHNSESQSENVTIFSKKLNDFEEKESNDKTIVIGDFNMNPFEKSMVKANGFNAVMSSKIANEKSRIVQGETYKFFYNPMWSLYGDIKNNVAGSYHYKNAELVNYQWNIFDQVLIRPSLIPNFVKDSVRFLDNDGAKSLLTKKGYPNKKYSDHLPLIFTLKLNSL
jgi:exonuclease III